MNPSMPPAVEAWSLNHWAAREVPDLSILSPGVSCRHFLEKTMLGRGNSECKGPEAEQGWVCLAATRPLRWEVRSEAQQGPECVRP